MATAKLKDLVRIHYTGRLHDGSVFDSSRDREPLEFEAGGRDVIPGISFAVVGMQEGEERTITVAPEDAFGPRREEMIQQVSRSALPVEAKIGDVLRATTGDQEVQVVVAELEDTHAVIDGNHPLAGQAVEFDLELVAVVGEGDEKTPPTGNGD